MRPYELCVATCLVATGRYESLRSKTGILGLTLTIFKPIHEFQLVFELKHVEIRECIT